VIARLYVAVPPANIAAEDAGGVFEMERRGTVFVVTVQLAQDPELLVTEFDIVSTPSIKLPTVTVKDFVSDAPAATVTV
jgi:hypothetical protein